MWRKKNRTKREHRICKLRRLNMPDDVWSYEYFDVKILCTNSLLKQNPLALCVAGNHLIIKKNLFAFPEHFFVLSTKYQLDECALHQEYKIIPDQIHPCAWLDIHRRWQAAFSLDMLNFDRWFSSYVPARGLDVLFHCACQELPVNYFKSISILYNLPGTN